MLFVIPGCNTTEKVEGNVQIANDYLEEHGYNVLRHINEDSFLLTEGMVSQLPDKLSCSVQEFTASDHIGKEMVVEYFSISNHPFDIEHEETMVSVIISDGKAIGGNSYNPVEKGMRGENGIFSLDGSKQY